LPSHGESGRLYVVGTGPGARGQMTDEAVAALTSSEYVIGNEAYLTALGPLLDGKQVIRSSMGKEVERAGEAVRLARDHVVSIVSGGDPGVYGMASIVLEVAEKNGEGIDIRIVPGVTAANAAASRIGSPLSGDFCVISLSDLLTPLDVIEKRLDAAFSMGVPVVLYNPKSRGRPHNLAIALGIAEKYLPGSTPVAVIKNAYRPGEEITITTLADATCVTDLVDMHSTVIIGGLESRIWRNGNDVKGIITPRGYHRKYLY
jgi:precorrin-3B C17-methyltransferase